MPDIDIDFANRDRILEIVQHVRARRDTDDGFTHHNTGIYPHSVPNDPITNIEEELVRLMNTEPLWDLLEQDDFTDLLFHVNGHGWLMRKMKPRSVEELAMCIALIRPAKKHLIGQTWTEIGQEIWTKPENGEYYFKKAHAVAYAHAIVVQMNQICEAVSYGYN